jgi:peptidoglycan-N-acetylglucosamine deacetylase
MRILTFDIEEWFHLLDHPSTRSERQWNTFPARFEKNLDRIFRILERHNTKATFFVLGWTAEKYPRQIAKIEALGYEVACHSSRHQLVYEQTKEEFLLDLRMAREAISSATGKTVDTYRAPGFSITKSNLWAFDILAEEGFSVDCSIFPARRAHGGLSSMNMNRPFRIETSNGFTLKEFPLNTASFLGASVVYSGGGYFRLFPTSLLEYLFSKGKYVMTYFHPRDFDEGQPEIPNLSPLRRFKSYYGIANCEEKLDFLLRNFDFTDVKEASESLNWESAPVHKFTRAAH